MAGAGATAAAAADMGISYMPTEAATNPGAADAVCAPASRDDRVGGANINTPPPQHPPQ